MNFSTEILIQLMLGFGLVITIIRDVSGQDWFQNRRKGTVVPRSAVGTDTCQTSSSRSGNCVPVIRCRVYWGRSNLPDLTNSSCGEESQAKVCCPLSDDDDVAVTTDTTLNGASVRKSTNVTQSQVKKGPSVISPPVINSNQRKRVGGRNFPENCGKSGATFRRIVGGQDSVLGAWPWMAVIYLVRRGTLNPECGGALITASHIVTAAHCTVTSRRGNTLNPRMFLVRLGELNLDSDDDGANPVNIGVKSVTAHENFSLRTFQNDIAILELTEAVQFSQSISPICLPFNIFLDPRELEDRNAIAAGWGSTQFDGEGSATLQEVHFAYGTMICAERFSGGTYQSQMPIYVLETAIRTLAGVIPEVR